MSVPGTWVEAQCADFLSATIAALRDAEPDAWRLFDGDADGCYALWAHLAAERAAGLPLPVSMDVIDGLAGPQGRILFRAGHTPAAAVTMLGSRS